MNPSRYSLKCLVSTEGSYYRPGGTMRTCVNCGSAINPDDVFCTNCGAELTPVGNQPSPERGFAETRREAARPGPAAAVMAPPRPYEERLRPPAPSAPTASTRSGETVEQRYARQTRNATVFIAIIVAIFTVLTVAGVIWTATNISRINSQLNGDNNLFSNTNCESQGGSNPNC
jgi:predicted nucleic acid-binding Zn ribbon protein